MCLLDLFQGNDCGSTYIACCSLLHLRSWCGKDKWEGGDGEAEDGDHLDWLVECLGMKYLKVIEGYRGKSVVSLRSFLVFCNAALYIVRRRHVNIMVTTVTYMQVAIKLMSQALRCYSSTRGLDQDASLLYDASMESFLPQPWNYTAYMPLGPEVLKVFQRGVRRLAHVSTVKARIQKSRISQRVLHCQRKLPSYPVSPFCF